jgi:hypothetical protein
VRVASGLQRRLRSVRHPRRRRILAEILAVCIVLTCHDHLTVMGAGVFQFYALPRWLKM